MSMLISPDNIEIWSLNMSSATVVVGPLKGKDFLRVKNTEVGLISIELTLHYFFNQCCPLFRAFAIILVGWVQVRTFCQFNKVESSVVLDQK